MTDAASRAAHRRAKWSGGKVGSFDELEQLDVDAWLAVPGSQKLEMVFDMWFEQAGEVEHEASARLQRSVGGVRTRAR